MFMQWKKKDESWRAIESADWKPGAVPRIPLIDWLPLFFSPSFTLYKFVPSVCATGTSFCAIFMLNPYDTQLPPWALDGSPGGKEYPRR